MQISENTTVDDAIKKSKNVIKIFKKYNLDCTSCKGKNEDTIKIVAQNNGLDLKKYRVLSPQEHPGRTAIVIVSHQKANRNKELFEYLTGHDVYLSLREGTLRFSPHLYNTLEEIDSTLSILNKFK